MNNIGLKKGTLEIMDYQDDYPMIYENEKNELLNIYKDKISLIEHVGSTSIKGIKSKPIIDILVLTDDLDDFKTFTESEVEGQTYTVKKEQTSSGDYLIRKEEDGKVKAFIHAYKTGDENGLSLILFRDYLNEHEGSRIEYENIKTKLYEEYKDDRKQYTAGKNEFITKIIDKAKKQKR